MITPNLREDSTSLKEAYKEAFLMGVAVNETIISGNDSISRKIILEQFNCVTPENIMKAEVLNPEPGVYNF